MTCLSYRWRVSNNVLGKLLSVHRRLKLTLAGRGWFKRGRYQKKFVHSLPYMGTESLGDRIFSHNGNWTQWVQIFMFRENCSFRTCAIHYFVLIGCRPIILYFLNNLAVKVSRVLQRYSYTHLTYKEMHWNVYDFQKSFLPFFLEIGYFIYGDSSTNV